MMQSSVVGTQFFYLLVHLMVMIVKNDKLYLSI